MKRLIAFSLLSLSILLLTQCSEAEPIKEEMEELQAKSTYEVIQSEVFDKACISCHQAGTTFARQSDLILTADLSYSQLINREPKNEAAKADDLLLVGTSGLASVYTSFLWEKINTPDYAHYYDDHPEYGELMPLGGQSITNGELRYINEWIVARAPQEGNVADLTLLEDTERFEIPSSEYVALVPPSEGMQLLLGPFDIAPQSEREFHYFQPLNNTEELYLNRVQIAMREGSHHLIMYDHPNGDTPIENAYRDIYNADGSFDFATVASILNQRFIFGTQLRNTDYTYPPGIALRIPENTGYDLNSHYVNKTDEIKVGEVSINLHTVPKSQVDQVADNIFESFEDIVIPAGKVTTLERTSRFDEKMNLFQLTSHAHRHMTEFEIYIVGGDRDGELIFFTNDWEHPPLITFDPPITLEKGHGLRARATYDNDTNKTLRFGLLSEDEMMIMFGAFYRD